MSELEVYADQFQVTIGVWGATLNFQLSSHQPPAPGAQPQSERVATVRTSLEHLKTMTMMIKREISDFESREGIQIQVPTRVLAGLGIAKEDWDAFWRPL